MRAYGLCAMLVVAVITQAADTKKAFVYTGTVVGPDASTPMAGVRVTLAEMGKQGATANAKVMAADVTDARGAFRIAVTTVWDHWNLLFADTNGMCFAGYPYVNTSKDYGKVVMQPVSALAGKVRMPEGVAIHTGMTVVAELRLNVPSSCLVEFVETARAMVAVDGSFAFPQLHEGTYKCRIVAGNCAPDEATVVVKKGFNYLDLKATPDGRIAGRVTDLLRRPVAGLTVSTDDEHSAMTDAEGNYLVTGLGESWYGMRVRGHDMVLEQDRSVQVAVRRGETKTRNLRVVVAGSLLLTLTQECARVAMPTNIEARISPYADYSDYPAINAAVVNAGVVNGTVLFSNMVPGEATIVLDEVPGRPKAHATIKSGARTTATLVLPLVHTLRGTVRDEAGTPLENAKIDLIGDRVMPRDDTDTGADGRYAVEGLRTGVYVISVDHDAGVPQTCRVTIGTNPPPDMPFVLSNGITVRGTVRDAQGQPVIKSSVTVEYDEDYKSKIKETREEKEAEGEEDTRLIMFAEIHRYSGRHDETDSNGVYVVRGLVPGKVQVGVSDDAKASARADLTLVQGITCVTQDLRLGTGMMIAGMVAEQDGTGVEGLQVSPMVDSSTRWEYQTETDDDGRFVICGLGTGMYCIAVATEQYDEPIATLDNVSADTTNVMVVLPRREKVQVAVVAADGAALSGAVLHVVRQKLRFPEHEDAETMPQTDARGMATLDLRTGSRYTVKADKPPLPACTASIDLRGSMTPTSAVRIVLGVVRVLEGSVVDTASNAPFAGLYVRVVSVAGEREK